MRILVTGGSGLVGSALARTNCRHEMICVGSSDYNLIDISEVEKMFKNTQPDVVIHLAARVGGVQANIDNPADFFYENTMINTNVLHGAYRYNVNKVVSMLSTCIFPNNISYPIKESDIHKGEPHETNFAYSYAKRMLDVQSRAYRKQHKSNFVTVVPNNLYGENDNFHLKDSHVIPAMIRKFHEASIGQKKEVVLWGDGTPLREFTYSRDIAEQLLFIAENYDDANPVNLGNSKEISIKNLAEIIASELNYEGKIVWDTSMPKGQHRKPSCKDRVKCLGWKDEDFTTIQTGIKKTCSWFRKNYPNVRGV